MKHISLLSSMGLLACLSVTVPASAAMDPYVKKALQEVCYSSATDRLYHFKRTVKDYRLKMKDVATKVVCNGEDIGSFAAEYGATQNANYIRNYQVGHVEIHELAKVELEIKPKG